MTASIPNKLSLLLLCLAVIALLAPYAGCNEVTTELSDSPSLSSSEGERSAPSGPARTTDKASTGEAPLDQIEDILSN